LRVYGQLELKEMATTTPQMTSETLLGKIGGRRDMEQEIEDEKKVELESQQVYPDDYRKVQKNGIVSCPFFSNTSQPTEEEMKLLRKTTWKWCSNIEGGLTKCHCSFCLLLKSRTDYYDFPVHFQSTDFKDARSKLIEYLKQFVKHVAKLDEMYETVYLIHEISNNGSNCVHRGKVCGIVSQRKYFQSHCIDCKWYLSKIVTFCLKYKLGTL